MQREFITPYEFDSTWTASSAPTEAPVKEPQVIPVETPEVLSPEKLCPEQKRRLPGI